MKDAKNAIRIEAIAIIAIVCLKPDLPPMWPLGALFAIAACVANECGPKHEGLAVTLASIGAVVCVLGKLAG